MPAFRFEAATAAGRIERGVLDADSARGARSLLRERGLTPVSVAPVEDGFLAKVVQSHFLARSSFFGTATFSQRTLP